MTEHVFKAADSDSAMEKAIRELGEDAMILSVIRKGDVTEVRAIKESLASVSPRTPPPFPKGAKSKPVSLSDALRSAENKRLGVAPQPNMVDRPALDFFFGDDPFIAPAGSHPKETKPNRQTQEPKDNIPADVERLFDETLSTQWPDLSILPSTDLPTAHSVEPEEPFEEIPEISMPPKTEEPPMVSEPEPLSDLHGPRILSQNGFSPQIVQNCIARSDLMDLESQLTYACHELAEQLSVPKEKPTPLDSEILFVFGPNGSGKTTTAAKLAFARQAETGIKPAFLKIGQACFAQDDKLQRFSQLLGTKLIDEIADDYIKDNHQVIVDCCLTENDEILEKFRSLQASYPKARIQPILTLPGTWSVPATEYYCKGIAELKPCTILTHLQIGGPEIAGFSTLVAYKATLLAACESDRISEGIEIIDASAIHHFLRDTFSYTDSRGALNV
jgi:hypothetical protein